jgi:hypothetical protein
MEPEWENVSEIDSEDFFEVTNLESEDVPGLQPISDSEVSKDDGLPGLQQVSDSSDDEDLFEKGIPSEDDLTGLDPLSYSDEKYLREGSLKEVLDKLLQPSANQKKSKDTLTERIQEVLTQCVPFPGDEEPVDPTYRPGQPRFLIERQPRGFICIYDRIQGFETDIHEVRTQWGFFSIGQWFAEWCAANSGLPAPWEHARQWVSTRKWEDTLMGFNSEQPRPQGEEETPFELAGIQVDRNKYPALQRNAAVVKGTHRILPKPIVARVTVNGHPARALLDSGSLGDFMSSTLVDQLQVKRTMLDVPLSLQLAVQGSRSKVNTVAMMQLQYQDINETRTFDVINLNSYDLILGTPWMHQHQIWI